MGYEELYATLGVKQATQAELGEGVEAIAEDIPREQEEVKVEKEKVPRVGEWELDQADRKDLEGLLLQDMQDSAADSDDGLCRSPIPFACAECRVIKRQHVKQQLIQQCTRLTSTSPTSFTSNSTLFARHWSIGWSNWASSAVKARSSLRPMRLLCIDPPPFRSIFIHRCETARIGGRDEMKVS